MKALLLAALALFPVACKAQVQDLADKRCMATAVYMEARGEDEVAQRAVMDVILNRAKKYGKTICEVVKAKGQFSWYVAGKKMLPYTSKMNSILERLDEIGRTLISENYFFFFNKKLKPKWAQKMNCVTLNNQNYCREEKE